MSDTKCLTILRQRYEYLCTIGSTKRLTHWLPLFIEDMGYLLQRRFLLVLGLVGISLGRGFSLASPRSSRVLPLVTTLRGGAQVRGSAETYAEDLPEDLDTLVLPTPSPRLPIQQTSFAVAMVSSLTKIGQLYSNSIVSHPIRTKSLTAGCVFALSDYLAQRVEGEKINKTRLMVSIAVGLFYFGPAAHYWYDAIFRLLPATSLISTLQKAALGQLIFGPSFTVIFFGTSLAQSGNFSLANWFTKIRQDLPGTWISGLGFWPIVDVISFSLIPVNFIPLFVNMCSLVWTIYLSLIANKTLKTV
jgi:hypothetical protein